MTFAGRSTLHHPTGAWYGAASGSQTRASWTPLINLHPSSPLLSKTAPPPTCPDSARHLDGIARRQTVRTTSARVTQSTQKPVFVPPQGHKHPTHIFSTPFSPKFTPFSPAPHEKPSPLARPTSQNPYSPHRFVTFATVGSSILISPGQSPHPPPPPAISSSHQLPSCSPPLIRPPHDPEYPTAHPPS